MKEQEWQYGEGAEYLSQDFTQCQRSDGTIYGSRGECAQKGAREVSTKKQNTLFSNANTNREGVGIRVDEIAKGPNAFSPSKAQVEEHVEYQLIKIKEAAPKMREGDLRATIQNSKKAIKMVAKHKDSENVEVMKKGLAAAIKVLHDEMSKRQKAEGKKPETLTSMLTNENLKKVGDFNETEDFVVSQEEIKERRAKRRARLEKRRAEALKKRARIRAEREAARNARPKKTWGNFLS